MLRKVVVGAYQANCYILGCKKTMEAAVIDPGDEAFSIIKEISRIGLKVKYILLTHGHPDHTGGVGELKKVTHAPVLIDSSDKAFIDFKPDENLYQDQKLQTGNYQISVIHTPGHSPGGSSFYTNGVIFTGDTLFAGSIGRTDLPGGDYRALISSVREKIFPLGDDIRVYPGHGPPTTIGREKLHNPFFSS